ncbi:MAG: hypothetical protein OEX12_00110 [Gammaproteobacteria bacterium]|nr:hypothetical protein [Gammaproteobacteria bacterium]
MALIKNTNAYVDLAEATAYFADRLDAAAWDDTVDAEREKALVTATMMLDNLRWTGQAASDAQLLAFPRIGEYFDPRKGTSVTLTEAEVPLRIIKGTYELAYHLLNNDGLLDDTGSVAEIEVDGAVKLKGVRSAPDIPSVVYTTIKPLLENRGISTWWRAN